MDAESLSCVRERLFKGVNVEKFFEHFKRNYRGKAYDSMKLLEVLFKIFPICKHYGTFVFDMLSAMIQSGAIRVIGKVGECSWSYIPEPDGKRFCKKIIFDYNNV